MPEGVAKKLNLELIKNTDIVIRTAMSEIHPVRHCVKFNVEIAGVIAQVTAYVLDIPQSYCLLLGRRWLYQVRAVGDYEKQTYVIYDAKGYSCNVIPAGESRDTSPEVMANPNVSDYSGLSDQEKDELDIGQARMQELIDKVIADARSQSLEQISDDEEAVQSETDEEEEGEVYCYPGSGSDADMEMAPKDRRQ